jgi:hypothetical protein
MDNVQAASQIKFYKEDSVMIRFKVVKIKEEINVLDV